MESYKDNRRFIYLFLGVFLTYLIVRIVGWNNTVLLEDTDSLGNIRWIKEFLTFDLHKIIDIDPDFTPFYLFFSAIFSLLTGTVETGARLCSFLFSIVLFFSFAGIGKHLAKPYELLLASVLLAFSPVLISLSYAVLTEPSYIATVYLGLWLFWTQYKAPTLGKAVLMGIVFGLCFLNRLEGIIYLAVIPFFQVVHYIFFKGRAYTLKTLLIWSLLYVGTFSAVIAPQVWRVSNIVGEFALNGRQVWSIVLNNPDGKSYREKIHGLDYSPGERNIVYLKRHPEAWKKMVSTFDPGDYIRTVIENLRDMKRHRLSELIGYTGLVFFIFGLFYLYRTGRIYEAFIICCFIGASLVPPLLHNVVLRHIAVIAPLMLLVIAMGVNYVSSFLSERTGRQKILPYALSMCFVFLMIGLSVKPLWAIVINPPTYNKEYSPEKLKEPVRLVKSIVKSEIGHEAVIVADTGYLAHYADAKQEYMPYANLDALLKYIDLKNADFLYLQEDRLKKSPFYQEYLDSGLPSNYVLIYSGTDAYGGRVELYRILRHS